MFIHHSHIIKIRESLQTFQIVDSTRDFSGCQQPLKVITMVFNQAERFQPWGTCNFKNVF